LIKPLGQQFEQDVNKHSFSEYDVVAIMLVPTNCHLNLNIGWIVLMLLFYLRQSVCLSTIRVNHCNN